MSTGPFYTGPWVVMVTVEGTGMWEEYEAEFHVASREIAQRVVDQLRDRVESVVAEPLEIYTAAAPVIRELSRRHGWKRLPLKDPAIREQRERDADNKHKGEIIR